MIPYEKEIRIYLEALKILEPKLVYTKTAEMPRTTAKLRSIRVIPDDHRSSSEFSLKEKAIIKIYKICINTKLIC
ncbi:MAG: hypothetical protein QXR50_06560 [Archaeoglobaceae archaeon]